MSGVPNGRRLELLLKPNSAVGIALDFDATQQLGLAGMQLDAGRVDGNREPWKAGFTSANLPYGFDGNVPLVDVDDNLAPFVEDLRV